MISDNKVHVAAEEDSSDKLTDVLGEAEGTSLDSDTTEDGSKVEDKTDNLPKKMPNIVESILSPTAVEFVLAHLRMDSQRNGSKIDLAGEEADLEPCVPWPKDAPSFESPEGVREGMPENVNLGRDQEVKTGRSMDSAEEQSSRYLEGVVSLRVKKLMLPRRGSKGF